MVLIWLNALPSGFYFLRDIATDSRNSRGIRVLATRSITPGLRGGSKSAKQNTNPTTKDKNAHIVVS